MTTQLKKFMLQLGLFLLVTLGGAFGGMMLGQAATLPAGAQLVSTSANVYKSFSSPQRIGVASGTVPTTMPTLTSVAANNLSSTNRITNKTTEIYLAFSGKIALPSNSTAKITEFTPAVMRNTTGEMTPGTESTNLATNTNSLSFSGNYLKIKVDFSDPSNFRLALPMDFGFILKTSDGSQVMHYYLGQATADNSSPLSISDIWEGGYIDSNGKPNTQSKKLTINSTYSASITTLANIKSSDTAITGYNAYPKDNLSIWAAPKALDGTNQVYKGTINSDGTFKIDFPKSIGLLTNASSISVFETNDMGDLVASGAMLKDVLDITADQKQLDVYPDDLADNISGQSDSNILQWLIKQAGVHVSHLGTELNNADLTFSADKSNLAQLISNLNDNASTEVTVSAKNTAGVATDGGVTITITKHNGAISFGHISNLNFGTSAVPTKTTLIAPEEATVDINDTRATNSKWSVTANATPLTDAAGHSINGLVYVDASGQEESLTNQDIIVATGSRSKGVNSVNAATNWTTTQDDHQTGIYFKAKPTIYSGTTATNYSGTINWTLYDTPDAT